MPVPAWKRYQEDAAAFFCDLGMDATTDEVLEGARGRHAIDVVVRATRAGVSQLWIVECKAWKRRVGKDRVLVLSEVVADVGADRGFLLSESSFQAGAVRVASHTNVTLTSLSDMRENAGEEKAELDARSALSRLTLLRKRVFDLGMPGFVGWDDQRTPGPEEHAKQMVIGRINLTHGALLESLAGIFPAWIVVSRGGGAYGFEVWSVQEAVSQAGVVIEWAERQVASLEYAGKGHRALDVMVEDGLMISIEDRAKFGDEWESIVRRHRDKTYISEPRSDEEGPQLDDDII